MPKRGISRFSVENLLSHSTEKLRRGIIRCFTKSLVSKNFMPMRGLSRFSIEKLLSHSTEKLCSWALLCFWNRFLISISFMDKKGGGSVTIFRQNFFYLIVPKKYRRGTLKCVTNFGYRKNLSLRGWCHDFLSTIFCLTIPKNCVGESFCVSEKFWYRKSW